MSIPSSISNYLERHGVHHSILEHPIAYTAQEEAAVAHVPGREWVKVVVFMADGQPALAVVPAVRGPIRAVRRDVPGSHNPAATGAGPAE